VSAITVGADQNAIGVVGVARRPEHYRLITERAGPVPPI
jgi:hypothetical protein